ncbi:MAG: metal-sensitive transcriptional regulator [Candidatus Sericytochromatia bacterium]
MSEDKQLIHRLNRVQGQIEAVRKRLVNQEPMDCVETLRLIKAANQALKKFGEAYVQTHLKECVRKDASREELEKGLQEVVSSAFYL